MTYTGQKDLPEGKAVHFKHYKDARPVCGRREFWAITTSFKHETTCKTCLRVI